MNVVLGRNMKRIFQGFFAGCDPEVLVVPITVTSIQGCQGTFRSGQYNHNQFRKLRKLVLPRSVTTIEKSTFQCCALLTHVTLPDTLTSIGPCAFSGCALLSHIHLPKSIVSIGHDAFANSGLQSVCLPPGLPTVSDNVFYR